MGLRIHFFAILLGLLFYFCACPSHGKKLFSNEEILLRHKCVSCHVLPKPGHLTDEELEQKLEQHKNRVTLSLVEKKMLREFLARK